MKARRRDFLAASAAALVAPRAALAGSPLPAIEAEIAKRHDESLARFQAWIREPAIAAESSRMSEGCAYMMELARDAGSVSTSWHGSGAHAPDEYFLIEPVSPAVAGWDRAVRSYAEYLHALA